MKIQRLFGRRADPTTQELPSSLTPLKFATFAPSEWVESHSSYPGISDPIILAPHDPAHRQSWPRSGWPSEPTNPYIVTPPVKKVRHDLLSGFHPGPAQLEFGPRASTMGIDDLPPMSKAYAPEFRRREDPPRNAEPVPAFQGTPPTITKSRNPIRKPLPRPPIPGAPDRGSSARTAPVPESLPSGLLAFQRPPDRPQPLYTLCNTSLGAADPHDTTEITTTTLSEIGMP